jgi:D-sedoheptulose 7-phosphate isomerase
MNSVSEVRSYLSTLAETLAKLSPEAINDIVEVLLRAYDQERTIFLFGNGGSAALASHFVCDLGKGTVNGTGKRFRVVALTDNVPLITAWANDSCYENIFAEQLANLVRRSDVAFAISGSGNSRNVLKALEVARDAGAITIGLSGFQGGHMKALCDTCMIVPSNNMQVIEDLHLSIAHAVFTAVKHKMSVRSRAVFAD